MASHYLLPRALGALLLGAGLVGITAPAAHAQASRTWVSGVGDDANPCSRTAPCKTFAGAISKTAAGGEIDALDPAGYGAVTITKAITIDGGGGQVASVLTSGTNGIVIAAGVADNVVLRNLRFQDVTASSTGCSLSAINIISARSVQLEHISITSYDNGISLPMTGSSPDVYVDVAADDVSVKNSSCTGINANPATGHMTRVALSNSELTQDNTGFQAGPGSESWLSGTQVVLNNTGLTGSGTIHDACRNTVAGNATNGAFTDHLASCQVPITTTPATTTVTYCVVPNLRGKSKAAAAAALSAQKCSLGSTHKKKGPRTKRGKVLSQTVPAGISVKQGTAVGVTLGR